MCSCRHYLVAPHAPVNLTVPLVVLREATSTAEVEFTEIYLQRQYKRTFQDATGCRVNVFSTTPLQAKERLSILTMPQFMGLYPITCSLVDSVTICLRR